MIMCATTNGGKDGQNDSVLRRVTDILCAYAVKNVPRSTNGSICSSEVSRLSRSAADGVNTNAAHQDLITAVTNDEKQLENYTIKSYKELDTNVIQLCKLCGTTSSL